MVCQDVRKILVMPRPQIGDSLVTTPALRALRRTYPAAQIAVAAAPYTAGLFQNSPDVDEIFEMPAAHWSHPAVATVLLRLRRERFSIVLDLLSNTRSCAHVLFIGGSRRVGFDSRRTRTRIYTDRAEYRHHVHAVLRYAAVLEPLGISLTESDRPLRIELTSGEREQARHLLTEAGLAPGQSYVALQATAGKNDRLFGREWPASKFAALADLMQQELNMPIVAMTRSASEAPFQELLARARLPILNLAGKTSIRVMGAVLGGAHLYVGYNTGPMHMAAALGTPVVALFDSAEELVVWHPWTQTPYHLVTGGPRCASCVFPECSGREWCLRTVEEGPVSEVVCEMHRKTLQHTITT